MSGGLRVWFGILALAAVAMAVLGISAANDTADLNNRLAQGAPQQTVVGLWALQDLAALIVYELAILVVALVSYVIWRGARSIEAAEPVREVKETDETIGATPPATEGRHIQQVPSDEG